jgi:hypothetical protein
MGTDAHWVTVRTDTPSLSVTGRTWIVDVGWVLLRASTIHHCEHFNELAS